MPEAPVNVMAVEVNSTSVRVTWNPPSVTNGLLVSYTVYYSIVNLMNSNVGPEPSVSVDTTQEPLSVMLNGLVEFTVYRVTVSASTGAGEGDSSPGVTVTTDPDSASPPTNLQVMVINSTAIQVSFSYPQTPRGEIFGYLIDYGVSGTDLTGSNATVFNHTLDVLDSMENQSIIVTNLAPYTFYVFRVSAYSFSNDPSRTHFGEFSPNSNAMQTLEDCKSSSSSIVYIHAVHAHTHLHCTY